MAQPGCRDPLVALALRTAMGHFPSSPESKPKWASLFKILSPRSSPPTPSKAPCENPTQVGRRYLAHLRAENHISDSTRNWPMFMSRFSFRYTHPVCRAYFFEAVEDTPSTDMGKVSTVFLVFADNFPTTTSVEHLPSAISLSSNRENHHTTRSMVFRSTDVGASPPPVPTRQNMDAYAVHELYEAGIKEHFSAWYTASESVRSIDLASASSPSAHAVRGFLARGACSTSFEGIGTGRVIEVCETIATGFETEYCVRNMYLVHADNPMCWTLLSSMHGSGQRKSSPVFPDELFVRGGETMPPHLVGTPLLLARHTDPLVSGVFRAWTLLQMRINALCDRVDMLPAKESAILRLLEDTSPETVHNETLDTDTLAEKWPSLCENDVYAQWSASGARDTRGSTMLPAWWDGAVPHTAYTQACRYTIALEAHPVGKTECLHSAMFTVDVPVGARGAGVKWTATGCGVEVELAFEEDGSGLLMWVSGDDTGSRGFRTGCVAYPSSDLLRTVYTDPVFLTFEDHGKPKTRVATHLQTNDIPVWETTWTDQVHTSEASLLPGGAIETEDSSAFFRRPLEISKSGTLWNTAGCDIFVKIMGVSISTSPLAAEALGTTK